MRMKWLSWRALTDVVFPVMAGSLLYLLFRPVGLLFHRWLQHAELGFVSLGRSSALVALPENPVTEWLLFCLPDGLWLFAFANALLLIWRESAPRWRLVILGALAVFYVIYEILQGTGAISGTFDLMDVFTGLLALAVSALIHLPKGGVYPVGEIKGC